MSGGLAKAWDFLTSIQRERAGHQAAVPLSGVRAGTELWPAFTGVTNGDTLPAPTASTVTQVTAVHACVQLIAGAIASMSVNSYERRPNGERAQLFDDDLWWVLNEQWNPRWSAAAGWEYSSHAQLLRGDGFALIERRGAAVTGLRPLHPQQVEVRASADGRRLVYRVTFDMDDGADLVGSRIYDQDDMLHIPGFGFDGLRSVSPLRAHLRVAAGAAAAMQEYTGRFFHQGARPDYVIQSQQGMTPEKLADIREQVTAYHAGVARSRLPMVLGGGLEVKPITMPLEDVELLGLRQFQVEEIARAFGVPPFMIGHSEKTTSWGSGVEAMGVGFVRYTLRQYLNRFENELNRKLIRSGRRFLAFDTSELEQADTKSFYEALATAMGRAGEPGFMTRNEARRAVKLPAVEGGDRFPDAAQDGAQTNA